MTSRSPDGPNPRAERAGRPERTDDRTRGGQKRDVDPERARRRRLLLWSWPAVLALLVAAAYLLGIWVGSIIGVRQAADERYAEALEHFEGTQRWEGVLQSWLPHYNTGTAHAYNGEYIAATDELAIALELVPEAQPVSEETPDLKEPWSPECLVRSNLAVSWELLGDETTDPEIAAGYFETAWQTIEPCAPSAPEHEETSERQQDKEEQSREEAEGGGGQGGDGDGEDGQDGDGDGEDQQNGQNGDGEDGEGEDEQNGGDGDDEQNGEDGQNGDGDGTGEDENEDGTGGEQGDPRIEDLLDRNREAEHERQRQEQERGGGSGSGQNW